MELLRAGAPGHAAVPVGFAAFGVANILYAIAQLRGTYQSGGVLDLGWDLGLLTVAAAAALAPEEVSSSASAPVPAISSRMGRTIAVPIGLAGILTIAIEGALRPEPAALTAGLVAAGLAIIAVRFVYSLRADRRYAELLEREVANPAPGPATGPLGVRVPGPGCYAGGTREPRDRLRGGGAALRGAVRAGRRPPVARKS